MHLDPLFHQFPRLIWRGLADDAALFHLVVMDLAGFFANSADKFCQVHGTMNNSYHLYLMLCDTIQNDIVSLDQDSRTITQILPCNTLKRKFAKPTCAEVQAVENPVSSVPVVLSDGFPNMSNISICCGPVFDRVENFGHATPVNLCFLSYSAFNSALSFSKFSSLQGPDAMPSSYNALSCSEVSCLCHCISCQTPSASSTTELAESYCPDATTSCNRAFISGVKAMEISCALFICK